MQLLFTLGPIAVIDRWPNIGRNRDLCPPHLRSTPVLGVGGYSRNIAISFGSKNDMYRVVWLPDVEKV